MKWKEKAITDLKDLMRECVVQLDKKGFHDAYVTLHLYQKGKRIFMARLQMTELWENPTTHYPIIEDD